MHIYKIALILGLVILINSQKVCENCFKDGKFTCNGKNCEAFYIDRSPPNYQSCLDAGCKIRNNGCYNQTKINDTVSICIACNYTLPHCDQCLRNSYRSCSSCEQGYYQYYPNVGAMYGNDPKCASCAAAVAGCERCSRQDYCSQCNQKYRNINGLCYTQDGDIVNGADGFMGSSSEKATDIIMVVLMFILLPLIGVITWVMFSRFYRKTGVLINQRND